MVPLYEYKITKEGTDITLNIKNNKIRFIIESNDWIFSNPYEIKLDLPIEFYKTIKPLNLKDIYDYEDELMRLVIPKSIFSKKLYFLICGFVKRYLIKNIGMNDKVLYFLRNEKNLIKIGISNDVNKRIEDLESQLSDKISLIKYVSFHHYERKLHRVFSKINCPYKGGREWFYPDKKLLDFIDCVNEDNFIEKFNLLNA